MNKSILKNGDVFLFGSYNDGSALRRLISELSLSPVYHTAIFCDNYIIEETFGGIHKATLNEYTRDKSILYINRYTNLSESARQRLTKVINGYPEGTPYNYAGLILFGLLLLRQRFISNRDNANELIELSVCALEIIIKIIKFNIDHQRTPMTCSQFVYECYKQSGNPLTINIKDKFIQKNDVNIHPSLFEKIKYNLPNNSAVSMEFKDWTQSKSEENEQSIGELFDVILEKKCALILRKIERYQPLPIDFQSLRNHQETIADRPLSTSINSNKLIDIALKFSHLLRVINLGNTNIPPTISVEENINYLEGILNALIAPGDLFMNCEQLRPI